MCVKRSVTCTNSKYIEKTNGSSNDPEADGGPAAHARGARVAPARLHHSSLAAAPGMDVEMGEISGPEAARPKITDAKGILQQNREFLDIFWDIAKPEQDTRLRAIENLIQYLKESEKVSGSSSIAD